MNNNDNNIKKAQYKLTLFFKNNNHNDYLLNYDTKLLMSYAINNIVKILEEESYFDEAITIEEEFKLLNNNTYFNYSIFFDLIYKTLNDKYYYKKENVNVLIENLKELHKIEIANKVHNELYN